MALEDGTISFNIWKNMGTDMITSISYSTDNGETWTTTNNTNGKSEHLTISVNVNEGDKILWKGDAQQMGFYDDNYYGDYVGSFFSSDCEFDVQGNVMSLLYSSNFKGEDTLEYEYQFAYLFNDYGGENECNVVNAKNLSLPATTLTDGCYTSMFSGCTSLTTAPELPATTLAQRCYSYMFSGCTALTAAPELPAITLATSCYEGMFSSCTNLTTAPELPATTLADYCYSSMFQDCTSLTTAPELPATTLATYCYAYMFYGCTSLNYIKAMFTTTPGSSYTDDWVFGVAEVGTFVINSETTWNIALGDSKIPNGWNVEFQDPGSNYTYIKIGEVKWVTKNLGAETATDAGLYFQWADTQGYTIDQISELDWVNYKYGNGTNSPHYEGMTKYNSVDGKTTLDASDDAANVYSEGALRIPTRDEWDDLFVSCEILWVTDYQGSGVDGYLITYIEKDYEKMFLPAAGGFDQNEGEPYINDQRAIYWTSSLYSQNTFFVDVSFIRNGFDPALDFVERRCVFPIRAVLNDSQQ